MNELSKSVLRRVTYIADTAKIRKKKIREEVVLDERDLMALALDMKLWARTYAIQLDGVKLRINWDRHG